MKIKLSLTHTRAHMDDKFIIIRVEERLELWIENIKRLQSKLHEYEYNTYIDRYGDTMHLGYKN